MIFFHKSIVFIVKTLSKIKNSPKIKTNKTVILQKTGSLTY